jgi:hypothetical protein
MEALVSLYLINHIYDNIKEIPQSQPSSEELIEVLEVNDNPPFIDVIEYFIDVALPKIKPIVTYSRNNFERVRRGNIIPYSKTRVYSYLALHQLKLKFLMIKEIIDNIKNDELYDEQFFKKNNINQHNIYLSLFAKRFYDKYKMNLSILFPKNKASERVKNLLDNEDSITVAKLLDLMTSQRYLDKPNVIKFIMREIKASHFVSKLIFAQMDLTNPFSRSEDKINPEEVMVSNDFIPELIPAICKNLAIGNIKQYDDCQSAFNFLLEKVLKAINRTVEIASRGQIQLELYETIYYTGNILSE